MHASAVQQHQENCIPGQVKDAHRRRGDIPGYQKIGSATAIWRKLDLLWKGTNNSTREKLK
eukprot:1692009-Karenia_brevis.AAC.1